MQASPWDVILTPVSPELERIFASTRPPQEKQKTKTDIVLEIISTHGPIETPQLAKLANIHGNQLWGLLKGPRQDGRVKSIKDGYHTKWVLADYKEST